MTTDLGVEPRLGDDGTVRIPLLRGGIAEDWATIDAADFPLVCGRRWTFLRRRHPYAVHGLHVNGKKTTVYMHRLILGLERGDGREVDHINHDGLDNRRANLRIVDHATNMARRRGWKVADARTIGGAA